MKGFIALSILVFWLISFPLNIKVLSEKLLFELFFLFHSVGYFILYYKFNFFVKRGFFLPAVFFQVIFTLIFIWLPFTFKPMIISAIGLISPLICLRTFAFLVKETGKLFPYAGILTGNLLFFFFNFLEIPSVILISIASLSLIILLFFKYPMFSENEFNKDSPFPGKSFLYLSFFIFYLISPFFYESFVINFLNIKLRLFLELIFYLFGITVFLLSIKLFKQDKFFFLVPLIGFVLLSLSSIPLQFNNMVYHLLSKFFILFSIGIIDVFSLFLFISYFTHLRSLTFLYFLITLGIFLGNIFSDHLFSEKSYFVSYLILISLIGLLLYYKFYITYIYSKRKEKIETSSAEDKKLTQEIFLQRINEMLPANVKKLSKREGEVLYLHVIEEKNTTEISKILKISRSSVKEYLKRAALKLGISVYELPNLKKTFFEEM